MKKIVIGSGIMAAIVALAFFALSVRTAIAPVACETDTQICFDGSKVSRTGPSCAFAACPPEDTSLFTGSTTLKLALNQEGGALGVRITPQSVVLDSRCPAGTQCVQAGTVTMSTRFVSEKGNYEQLFTLGEPVNTDTATVTLVGVSPDRKAGETITDYEFTFTVAKRADAPLYTSSFNGTVMLAPTCPVAKNPPDPKCANKPYATTVVIYRNGSTEAFATTTSLKDGSFEFAVPPGSYVITAGSDTGLPRCAPVQAAMPLNGHINLTVFCDTGIR